MRKVNSNQLEEDGWASPKGKFAGFGKHLSIALGRREKSTDLLERHPFDVEILRVPPGKTPYPYHSHSAQWEFYHVISGRADVRDDEGMTAVEPGDAFIFKPGEAHQFFNTGSDDFVVYVIADNPVGGHSHYPDSNKWSVAIPKVATVRCEKQPYYDGEE